MIFGGSVYHKKLFVQLVAVQLKCGTCVWSAPPQQDSPTLYVTKGENNS